jgi:hypothetical protein
MSDSEKFLERWSRRKRDAAVDARAEKPVDEARAHAREEGSPDAPKEGSAAAPKANEPFDVSTLPSLESIGANSDVRAFMQPGVPLELRHAALRRAWSTDVQIRDFIGLVENVGDFNDPRGMPGFGPLPEGIDIKSLLAQAIGAPQPDTGKAERAAEVQDNPEQKQHRAPDPPAAAETRHAPDPEPALADESALQRNKTQVALQKDFDPPDSSPPPRRRGHGSALPK